MKKIVFITGASSGIGLACARKFAAEGFDLIITARRKERLEKIGSELGKEFAVKVICLCFDVQNKDAVFENINQLPPDWKKIDVLVNNAGLALGRDLFQQASMDDWETMIDTNVKGLLYVSRAIIPLMIQAKKGHIINLGSTAGKEVYEKGNVYCASKFAVDAISKAMRIDLLAEGIKVSCIQPGATETEFSLVRFKQDQDKASKVYEGYQPLQAVDIAEVIYFTASQPAHVCINDLVMTSTAQANSYYLYQSGKR